MTNMREEQPAKPETFTAWLRQVARPAVDGAAGVLAAVGLTPNAITVLGVVFSAAAAYLASQGLFLWAGVVLVVGLPLDAMDGAVARKTGKVSRTGALLDSTLDRYGEFLVLAGLAYYFAAAGEVLPVLLVVVTLFGSVMVSYVRARSEGLHIDNKVGLMTRVERAVVTVLALLTGYVTIGLWMLAILTHVTVTQRVWRAIGELEKEDAAGEGR